ncbi:MAG TPA: DUF1360 domain-containing protein [Gemmatimonadales bacterium]|nr:DUF1360 domain-containing protein [Gemmatimonadales bacterium]
MLGAQSPAAVWFVVTTLAVWRVAGFVVYDEGLLRSGSRLRAALDRVGLGGLSRCFHCASVWIALIGVLVVFEVSPSLVVVWWAIAGAASALELMVGGVRRRFGQTADDMTTQPQEEK